MSEWNRRKSKVEGRRPDGTTETSGMNGMGRAAVLLAVVVAMMGAGEAWGFKLAGAEGGKTNAVVLAEVERWGEETLAAGYGAEVAGTAERDAWLVAQEVTWAGTAKQDLRAFAGAVKLSGGRVEGNAVAGGRGVRMDAGARVEGDLLVLAQQVTLDGEVGGGTWIWATEAVLGGTFEGGVRVHAEKLRLKPGTVIRGVLVADVAEPFAASDVEVKEIRRTRQPAAPDWRTALKARARFAGFFYLAMLLAGWIYAWLFPVRAAMGAANLGRSPFKSFFAGLAGLLAAWVVAVAGLGSAVGIPLALAVLGLTLLFAVAALPVAGLWAGRLVFRGAGPERSQADLVRNLAGGLLVLSLLGLVLGRWGTTVLAAFWMMGYGSLVVSLFQRPRIVRAVPGPVPPQQQEGGEGREGGDNGGGGDEGGQA